MGELKKRIGYRAQFDVSILHHPVAVFLGEFERKLNIGRNPLVIVSICPPGGDTVTSYSVVGCPSNNSWVPMASRDFSFSSHVLKWSA